MVPYTTWVISRNPSEDLDPPRGLGSSMPLQVPGDSYRQALPNKPRALKPEIYLMELYTPKFAI